MGLSSRNWGTVQVAKRVYYFPKGYTYSITTEYIDQRISGHRYIFRPTTATVTGTLSADATQNVSIEVALDYYHGASTQKSKVQDQYNQMSSALTNLYTTSRSMIEKSYAGKSQKKKREKYLTQLDVSYISDIQRINQAFGSMLDSIPAEESILHVGSVDSVNYSDDLIYDADDRTVVIE